MAQKEEEIIIYTNKNQADILFSIKKEPELIMNWLSSLTDLEQKIVSIIYNLNKAVTIKEIRNTLVTNSNNYLLKDKHNFLEKLYYSFPFLRVYNFSNKQLAKKLEVKASSKKAKNEGIIINTKDILENFPSFRRIENSVKDLINLKIILERNSSELKNKKIKGLFYLNPIIRYQLDKIKEKYIKEHKLNIKK